MVAVLHGCNVHVGGVCVGLSGGVLMIWLVYLMEMLKLILLVLLMSIEGILDGCTVESVGETVGLLVQLWWEFASFDVGIFGFNVGDVVGVFVDVTVGVIDGVSLRISDCIVGVTYHDCVGYFDGDNVGVIEGIL